MQVPALRGRFRYTPRADVGDEAARQAFWLMLPRAIGMGANQITFLVNTALASTLAVGAVVTYNVAFNVLQIPLGVIGLPLGIVLLPTLSRALATGEETTFGRTVVSALRLLLWAMLLVSAVGIVARDQVTELLFGWGFDETALEATAMTLGVFLLGLPAHALNIILARAFYSGKDTITPVSVAIASVGVNVVVSLATVDRLGLAGLALGIAIGAWFEAVTLTLLLARRHASVRAAPVVRVGISSLVGVAGSRARGCRHPRRHARAWRHGSSPRPWPGAAAGVCCGSWRSTWPTAGCCACRSCREPSDCCARRCAPGERRDAEVTT